MSQEETPVEASEELPPRWSDTEETRRELHEKLKDFGALETETDRPRPLTPHRRGKVTIVPKGSKYEAQPGERVVYVDPAAVVEAVFSPLFPEGETLGELKERIAEQARKDERLGTWPPEEPPRVRRPGKVRAGDPAPQEELSNYMWDSPNKPSGGDRAAIGQSAQCKRDGGHYWIHSVKGGEPVSVPRCSQCGDYDWEDLRRQAVEYARQYACRLLEETYGYFDYPDGSRAMKWVEGRPQLINIQQIYNLFSPSESVNLSAIPDLQDADWKPPLLLMQARGWSQVKIGDRVIEDHLHVYRDKNGYVVCDFIYGDGAVCGACCLPALIGSAPANGRRIYAFDALIEKPDPTCDGNACAEGHTYKSGCALANGISEEAAKAMSGGTVSSTGTLKKAHPIEGAWYDCCREPLQSAHAPGCKNFSADNWS